MIVQKDPPPVNHSASEAAPETRTPWQRFLDDLDDNPTSTWDAYFDRVAAYNKSLRETETS